MTAGKQANGNHPRTKRKVLATPMADTSASRNPHRQTELSGNTPITGSVFSSAEGRHRKIPELAYLKAEQRDFVPGYEVQDWLEAEKEVDETSRPLPSY